MRKSRRFLLFVFCVFVSRGCMPCKGWSSLPVPDGWYEVIRGPRPPSVQWPHQQKGKGKGVAPSAAPRGRWRNPDRGAGRQPGRNAPPPSVPTGGNERRTPEEVVQGARARVVKLEAAISAVGESDPTFPALREALSQARRQAQVPPVESRIKSSEFFIERAKNRVEKARKEVDDAKAKVVAAEITLTSEVSALQEGQLRHASLLVEASRTEEQPPRIMPVDFKAELVQLRSLVVELQREREELRSEFRQRGVATPAEESRPRKSIRSLSTPATDLMLPNNQLTISSGRDRDPSVVMETLIDGGSAIASRLPMEQ